MYRLNDEHSGSSRTQLPSRTRGIEPQAAQVDADAAFPRQSIAALGERGLLGLTVPRPTAASARGCGRWPRPSTPWRSGARRPRWST